MYYLICAVYIIDHKKFIRSFYEKSILQDAAEWEKHTATQLHWPSNSDTWPGERLKRVEKVYLEIISALHSYEPIILMADIGTDTNRLETHIQRT